MRPRGQDQGDKTKGTDGTSPYSVRFGDQGDRRDLPYTLSDLDSHGHLYHKAETSRLPSSSRQSTYKITLDN